MGIASIDPATGAVLRRFEEHAPEAIPVSLVYPAQGMLPLKARAFLDWSASRLRTRFMGA